MTNQRNEVDQNNLMKTPRKIWKSGIQESSFTTREKAPRQEEKPKVQSVRVKPNKGPCLSNKTLFVRKITDESDITLRQANNAAAKTSKDAAVQAEW